MRLPFSILVLISVATSVQAQSIVQQPRSFEVASIRPNQSGSGRVSGDLGSGGRVTLTNVSVRELIRDAFRLRDVQLVGGPPEVLGQRFDIVASAGGNASWEEVRRMMRVLRLFAGRKAR